MDKLYKKINEINKKELSDEPIIFDLGKKNDQNKLDELLENGLVNQVSDDYVEQLKELFAIKNPTLVYTPDFGNKFKDFLKNTDKKIPLQKRGRWVFFPWLSSLAHILEKKDFQSVRTARNCYLISPKEQEIFYKAVI